MDEKRVVVGRTTWGQDFIGHEGFGGMILDVFRLEDIVTDDGVFPMIKPFRSIIFTKNSAGKRKRINLKAESVQEYFDIENLTESAGEIISILKESYLSVIPYGE